MQDDRYFANPLARSLAAAVLGAAVFGCGAPPAAPKDAAAVAAVSAEPPPQPTKEGEACVRCHRGVTPGIVGDWESSRHARQQVDCSTCHGTGHSGPNDTDKVKTVTADTCGECHPKRLKQFKAGKHAVAWAAMKAMPTTHSKPVELIDGMKGCGACHKLGLKSEEEVTRLRKEGGGFGLASCDACHTRHTFSVKEAREPEACATCHMGFDHPQWEMYSTSKHGVRHALKRAGVLSESSVAPTCQQCHMPDGNHAVKTAWGFLGVRTNGLAPYPGEDPQWWKDRVTILQALGVLDLAGKPTPRLALVKQASVARLTKEDFDTERNRMIEVCSKCHSKHFAVGELEKGDRIIQKSDHLMAAAIRVVAGLYQDGVLRKPKSYSQPFPDLLTFHDAPTPIEDRLFTMHLKHRMRAFQGVFHANPDYALWYGWNEMVQDLDNIKKMATDLRRVHAREAKDKKR